MRLVTYRSLDDRHGEPRFGSLRDGRVLEFAACRHRDVRGLGSMADYLAGLPGTFERAAVIASDDSLPGTPVDEVRLLSPVPRPAALLDFGTSPAHLRSSARTLLRRSLPPIIGPLLAPAVGRAAARSRSLRHYKGNHHAVSGPGDTIPWPAYSAYVDIEPELAFVTGPIAVRGEAHARPAPEPAGYLIWNDASARDVQLAEMLGTGPALSKDFDASNGLGPWLVTPDEVPDPLDLAVTVRFAGPAARSSWHGTTRDYTHHPRDVLAHLAAHRSIPAGTIVGMGTVPGTCGLDRDEWIEPGESFTIGIDGLGELSQRFGAPATMPRSRWGARPADPRLPSSRDRLVRE